MVNVYDKQYFEGGEVSNYGQYTHEICYNDHEKLADVLKKVTNPSNVLDIGCAKGFLVEGFYNNGVDAYGVDISEYAISCSSKKIDDKLFVLNVEKQKIPFQNDYFDLIILSEVVEHLGNFDLILNEMKRVLTNDGYIFLTTPTKKIFKKEKDVTHINVHNKKFWIKKFECYDFILDDEITESFLNEKMGYYAQKIIKLGSIGRFILSKSSFFRTSLSIRLFFRKNNHMELQESEILLSV